MEAHQIQFKVVPTPKRGQHSKKYLEVLDRILFECVTNCETTILDQFTSFQKCQKQAVSMSFMIVHAITTLNLPTSITII